jgi:hypothetical protein
MGRRFVTFGCAQRPHVFQKGAREQNRNILLNVISHGKMRGYYAQPKVTEASLLFFFPRLAAPIALYPLAGLAVGFALAARL